MKTLFVDSSRKSLSVALALNDELLLVSNVDSYSKHSNYLMNEIKRILEKFNLKPNDIDNYVVLNGPGSFTGVRVGVTVCKTLAWTLSKKIYKLNNIKFNVTTEVKDNKEVYNLKKYKIKYYLIENERIPGLIKRNK